MADKGDINQRLLGALLNLGLKLVTQICPKMNNQHLDVTEKILLPLIETINDQLKNVCQIEHSRHRCPTNFLVYLIAGLNAYTKKPKRPSLNLDGSAPYHMIRDRLTRTQAPNAAGKNARTINRIPPNAAMLAARNETRRREPP